MKQIFTVEITHGGEIPIHPSVMSKALSFPALNKVMVTDNTEYTYTIKMNDRQRRLIIAALESSLLTTVVKRQDIDHVANYMIPFIQAAQCETVCDMAK